MESSGDGHGSRVWCVALGLRDIERERERKKNTKKKTKTRPIHPSFQSSFQFASEYVVRNCETF